MALAPTLPGISFDSVPRPLDDALPRMDVCGFVGFASSGPINLPVVVEDPVRFREIFGPDPVLARTDAGEAVRAKLGAAIEAFFANGGARAWVVRVAATGDEGAVTNHFEVPQLMVPGPTAGRVTGWSIASLPARSAGSWSDSLTASAALSVKTTVATEVADDHLVVDHAVTVTPGEVLRISLDDGRAARVVVNAVAPHEDGQRLTLDPTRRWLVDDAVDPATIAGASAFALTSTTPVPLPGFDLTSDTDGSQIEVDNSTALDPGDVVALEPTTTGDPLTFIRLGDEHFDADDPVDGPRRFVVAQIHQVAPLAAGWSTLVALPVVEVQQLRLAVRSNTSLVGELDGLGMTPEHPRSISALPDDDAHFALLADLPRLGPTLGTDQRRSRPLTPLEREASAPRFPLAAPEVTATLFPLGMSTDPTAAKSGPPPAEVGSLPTPVRNGLGQFDAALFVDPAIAGLGVDTIVPTANAITFVSDRPRRLVGIHALAHIDDLTIVAVPDAAHSGWDQVQVVLPPPLTAPHLDAPTVDADAVQLTWSDVTETDGYEFEHATDPTFADPSRTSADQTEARVTDFDGCTDVRYFRVRAIRGTESGPWSNVVASYVPAQTFLPCAPPEPPPEVDTAPPADPIEPPVVWRARTPIEAEPWLELRAIQTAVLRWCAARGDVFAILSTPASFTAQQATRHRGVLRGATPAFDATGGQTATGFLSGGVPPLTDVEDGVLGVGALYHPWLVEGWSSGGRITTVPPDGAVAGVYAARARSRGAWIAPARVPIDSVVALSPKLTSTEHELLVAGRINPIAQEPAGFLCITANTLSSAEATRPVNVRRLLQLLRRLARREGMTLVFDPNSHELRRLVHMRFERMLTGLYRRGAFAGATPSEAFQVSTGPDVNPPSSVESGRLVVEIRVAPSIPLEFLTVRLVLTGNDLAAAE